MTNNYVTGKTLVFVASITFLVGSVMTSIAYLPQAEAFNDKNNQFVFNSHNHLQISEDHGIASNSGNTFNDGTSHFNDNFNDKRGETFEERYKSNSHSKPANDN